MKKLTIFLVFALCVSLLLSGCGKAQTDDDNGPVGPQPDPNRKAADSYSYTENANQTYSYEVWGRSGKVFVSEKNSDKPVNFEAISDELLVVYGQAGTGIHSRWARICDVQNEKYAGIGGYLAAWDTRVAFVDERSGGIHVFICETFVENVYHGVLTLENAVDNTDPIESFELSEDGILSVTYRTGDGNKTVEISMAGEE